MSAYPTQPTGFFARDAGGERQDADQGGADRPAGPADQRIEWLGLAVPTPSDRLATCASIAASARCSNDTGSLSRLVLRERLLGLLEQVAYVIDVDGCSFGPRWQTETNGWQDPLVPVQTWPTTTSTVIASLC